MIFNIRGISGSGKSYIVHSILNANEHEPIPEVPGTDIGVIGYHVPSLMTNILGRYGSTCGGCDGFGSQDEICGKVCRLKDPNLIFEGKLVSFSFGRYNLLTKRSGPIIFCFLDTSIEECIERVYQRREKRGKLGSFDEQRLHRHYKDIQNSKQKFVDAGHIVYELKSKTSVEDFMEIYNKHRSEK